MNISQRELSDFLVLANRSTYANKSAIKSEPLRPSSEDYHFELNDLAYHDTYFGGKDFIGNEIVYKNEKPVWGMTYYGYIIKQESKVSEIYDPLSRSLV